MGILQEDHLNKGIFLFSFFNSFVSSLFYILYWGFVVCNFMMGFLSQYCVCEPPNSFIVSSVL